MNKLILIAIYVQNYLFVFPAELFHEMCHWFFTLLFWGIGAATFPKLVISRWMRVTQDPEDPNSYIVDASQMHVNATYSRKGAAMLVSSAPLWGLVTLFFISPWYLDVYYLSQLPVLFLSYSDMQSMLGNFSRSSQDEVYSDR